MIRMTRKAGLIELDEIDTGLHELFHFVIDDREPDRVTQGLLTIVRSVLLGMLGDVRAELHVPARERPAADDRCGNDWQHENPQPISDASQKRRFCEASLTNPLREIEHSL